MKIAIPISTAWLVLTFACVCGNAADADALAISANILARHLPFGTVLDPMFASADSNQIVGYTRCGDSALWTGSYLAAEAFRYRVTRAPEALDNVKRAVMGLRVLADVTGTNLLARCIVPTNSPFAAGILREEAHNGIYMSSYIWVGNTSRDQYSGAIFGLGVAYDVVDDAETKIAISALVTRLVDFLQRHNWNVVMPDGKTSTTFLVVAPHEILAFLQVARHMNPKDFSRGLIERAFEDALSASVSAPIKFDVQSDSSYFKFNLDYMTMYNLVRLDGSSANTGAYQILRDHTAGHQNAFFNMIDRALKGPNAARDSETVALLNAWLQRPQRDKFVDLRGTVPVCGDQACQPAPVALRPPTDFIWQRNPFQLAGGGSGTIETAGIDYILPYWMARFYGVGSAFVVQSAAASSSSVAPESIASIFGSNLAARTEQASALPLPSSLGGVSLTVRDAAGTDRGAPLIYVAQGQINFIVPAGTAPGNATFTIANGSTTLSAAGTVQTVSPTLFSMSGNGAGVAAATAVRTQAANPQLQSPVPVFQCDASGCVSVPIDVGVDTPVYVTFYGTGIRNRSSVPNVIATINGIRVLVIYAGPQPSFAGLDQVNVTLPLNLRGRGEADVVLTVDGQTSNTVTINLK